MKGREVISLSTLEIDSGRVLSKYIVKLNIL